MRAVGEVKDITTTQASLARYLGLSKARITQLVDEEIVMHGYDGKGVLVADSIKNYFINKVQNSDVNVNFWEEKGLHERAKRELAELKLEKARGKLYKADDVEKTFTALLMHIRTNLMNLANRLPQELEGCTEDEIAAILNASFENLLEEMSNFDTKSLADEGDED